MHDRDRYRLLFGPYTAPAARRGDYLTCEARGREVRVGGLTDAPIPWPRVLKTGRPSLIVCGDLVRAIRRESEIAVAHHWGVSVTLVWAWRKALGVARMTEGTTRLYADYQPEKITDGAIANMRQTSRTPESRQRQRTNKIGKPAHPATIQALARAARRKKTEAHRRAIARAVSDWWAKQPSPHSPVDSSDRSWTEQEDRALGVTLDRHVAAMTGRTIPAVRSRRKQLGIHESRHSRLHHEPKAK